MPLVPTPSAGLGVTRMRSLGFPSSFFFLLLVSLPIVFGQIMAASLAKLQLDPTAAAAVIVGVFVGGLINIPIRRIVHSSEVIVHPFAIFGLHDLWPQLRSIRRETIIAVNVGGCLIPTGLAAYELVHLAALSPYAVLATAIASVANIAACFFLARPVPGVGILMPGLIPAALAAILALMLAPSYASPVAFIAGVAGPLVGADLLHLKDMESGAVGIASIGGAGTFDGIVLSGIVAAYLA